MVYIAGIYRRTEYDQINVAVHSLVVHDAQQMIDSGSLCAHVTHTRCHLHHLPIPRRLLISGCSITPTIVTAVHEEGSMTHTTVFATYYSTSTVQQQYVLPPRKKSTWNTPALQWMHEAPCPRKWLRNRVAARKTQDPSVD